MSAVMPPGLAASAPPFSTIDVPQVREDFPILRRQVHGRPLVYLDNAATTHKPRVVLDALEHYYTHENANVHRGVHILSQEATFAFERARGKVARLLGAPETREVIFTRGTTEAINLVASSWGRKNVKAGDEVLVSALEHHSNIVPWQLLCQETGAKLVVIPMTDAGELMQDEYQRLLSPRARLVAVGHVSNALGTVNPVADMAAAAHRHGALILVDGAQAAPHLRIDVKDIGCDFYAVSGHKAFGPTGIGALWGRAALLEAMPPYQGGGDMILSVTWGKTTYNELPYKFEAGTPAIAQAIGFGTAADYVMAHGLDRIAAYEHDLLTYATAAVSGVAGVRIVGTAREKAAVLSFVVDGAHPHDVGTILDREGIAIRTGHHCAQPVMDRLGIPATCRASFALYNTRDEVDALIAGLHRVKEVFG